MAKVDKEEQASDEPLTPVCAIGASAGGVAALQEFFGRLPGNLGLAYVVIIHLAPDHPSHMSEILTGRTTMPVHQVTDSPQLCPNCVYVIPPDRELVIEGNDVRAREFTQPRGRRAPIDVFFRSVAAGRGDGLAVVMTGAGSDGAVGVKAVKEKGGVIFVQDPSEAEYPMMPRNAIATGVADFIGPVHYLVERIVEVVRSKKALRALREDEADEALRHVLGYLRARTGHDFTNYKRSTVLRRVGRRMQVARLDSLADYARYLHDNPAEAQELFGDLLISVTSFFRDHEAFSTLAEKAVQKVCEKIEEGGGIRAWVVGCATGEEAYSLAILLLEEVERRRIRPQILIFATDLDEGALATAREGRYPRSIEADVSEERLERFFAREGDHYRIRQSVRDSVLFSAHSALKDPPFIRVDLISCRNLLIYLERDLQTQLCTLFHYALNPRGFLFLGTAETADATPQLFKAIDRAARLYQAKPQAVAHVPLMPGAPSGPLRLSQAAAFARTEQPGALGDLHATALERTAPPSALVDDTYRVLHLSPTAGHFIRPSEGPYSADLPSLVRPELRLELKSALQRAFETGEPVLTLPVPVAFDGSRRRVVMKVATSAAENGADARAVVFFIDGGLIEPSDEAHEADKDGQSEPVRRLMDELQAAEERLRQSRLEHEQATQELRATNEELQSINEEYRSTSEELETSKEELQSMNEELQTVNAELKTKLATISSAHSDLKNLIAATAIGTLFLDSDLRIRMFTPTVAGLFNINENDTGRPITDFTHNLDRQGVAEDARQVLATLVPIESEVTCKDGRGLIMRIRPYRSVEDHIEGVVITFVDVTELRQATVDLRASEARLRRVVETETVGVVFFDDGGRLLEANDAFLAMTGFSRAEVNGGGLNWRALTPPEWAETREREMARLAATGRMGPYEKELLRKDGSRLWMLFAGQSLGDGTFVQFCLDVSERKAGEEQRALLLRELSHRVKNMLAVVQSIARQTLRSSPGTKDFANTFERRLQALGQAHAALISQNWNGAALGDLVGAAMKSFLPDGDRRVQTKGPAVSLSPNATVSFAMALHELGTNAVKHGALSTPDGKVEIAWGVAGGEDGRLVFTWTERDGPKVAPPKRKGFGSRMIEKGVAHDLGAEVAIDYRESGVICTMELPIGEKIRIA